MKTNTSPAFKSCGFFGIFGPLISTTETILAQGLTSLRDAINSLTSHLKELITIITSHTCDSPHASCFSRYEVDIKCRMHMCRQTPKHIMGCQVWIVSADHFPLLNEPPHLYEMRANGCDIMSDQRKSDSCVSISCICFVFVCSEEWLVFGWFGLLNKPSTVRKSFMGYWTSSPLLTCRALQKKYVYWVTSETFSLLLQFMLMFMWCAGVHESVFK